MNNPQVGGVYPVKDREGLSFRVLAFDDTQVQILHVQGGKEHGEMTICREYFEEVTFPEDRGPIPELIAALEGLLALVNFTEARYGVPCDVARAVLAKVKTAASPDSREVTA